MNLANWISVFRIILIPFFISSIVYYRPEKDFLRYIALFIFILAVLSDGIDGYIARTRKLKTQLGSFLDPMADKLLLSSSFIALTLMQQLPPATRLPVWATIIFISRDVILVTGSLIMHLATGNLKITPSRMGKLTTFFQMLTIICLLLKAPFSFLILELAVFFTVISCFDYIAKGNKVINSLNNHLTPKNHAEK